MELPFTHELRNEKETEYAAELFSSILNSGDVVALNGELGVGKTFFVKSVCRQWNIFDVTSPSFTILNRYKYF